VEEVAFGHLDVRIISFLLKRSETQNPILITHQEIADELGSSREVVSRILSNLAHQGLIQLGRGEIEIVNHASLSNYPLM
jgi:CRP/FNR family transcriptional regulator